MKLLHSQFIKIFACTYSTMPLKLVQELFHVRSQSNESALIMKSWSTSVSFSSDKTSIFKILYNEKILIAFYASGNLAQSLFPKGISMLQRDN